MLRFGERNPGGEYRPRPSVYAVAFDVRGRVALVSEDDGFYLPGGGIETGETVLEALVREIREECACESRILDALGESTESSSPFCGSLHSRPTAPRHRARRQG